MQQLPLPAPRSHFTWRVGIPEHPVVGFNVFHQSFAQIAPKFSPGVLQYSWWSWQFTVSLWWRTFTLLRVRETSTAPGNPLRLHS